MRFVLGGLTTSIVLASLAGCPEPREASPKPSTPTAKTTPATTPAKAPTAPPEPITPPQAGPFSGKAVPAKPALRGVDAFSTITAEQAKAIAADGFDFAVRYVRHADSQALHITRDEAEGILAAGLSLMLVQEGRGWKETLPSAALGKSDGEAGAAHAESLGYPATANLWLDVEGITDPAATASDVIAYAEAWHTAVHGKFVPGYYVGPLGKLDAAQLGALPFEHFWKSGTDVPTPAGRGYQLVQYPPRTVGGVQVDENITQVDEKGRAVLWMAP